MKIKRIISIFAALILCICSAVEIIAVEPNSAKLRVIDVSEHNNYVNWDKAADSIDGAILRIGYRGSVYRDRIAEDKLFYSHIQGVNRNNIHFGIYFYSFAFTKAEAVEEAEWVIATLKKYNLKPDYPVYIDVEEPDAQTLLTTRQRTDVCIAFCETMKKAGYYSGVYANKYWFTEMLYASELAEYPIWLAQFNSTCTYTGKYDMWQYTNRGVINGINGNIDVSECYRNYPEFIRRYGYNGFTGTETPPVETKDYSKRGTYKITSALNVRTGRSDSFMSMGTLAKGSDVYVDYTVDGWGAIPYSNTVGWIKLGSSAERISKYMTTQSGLGYYCVTADVLNVRDGGSTAANKVSEVYEGNYVFISGIQNGWGYFYGNGSKRWISLDYAVFCGTVSFETGVSGKYIQPVRIKKGSSSALPEWDISVSDKQFSGWSLTSGGTVKYADKASLTMGGSNVVLYAAFSQGAVSAYYSFKTSPRQHTVGMIVTGDELLTESGYISKYISLASGVSNKVTAAAGKYIGTGSEITFVSDGKNVDKLTVVLTGDCNGDGVCDTIDLSDALNILHGDSSEMTYTDAQKKAADVNLDGKVDSTDINAIKKSAFGTADLPK